MTKNRACTSAVILLLWLIPPAFGQEAARKAAAGRVVEVKLAAPSLKGNLLGDPAEQTVAVYLPPSYDASPSKRYPTLYLLHGFGGDGRVWMADGQQSFNVPPLLDALTGTGAVREMIVVAPSARNAYGGSFYANSAATGNWEDYVYRDLVTHVDANYRTLARASSRGVAGHSMGGYGALMLAMKHPEVFGAVYALSPCCVGLEGDLGETNPAWARASRFTSREQVPRRPKSFEEFFTVAFVALSAALSPDAGRAPLYVEMPFVERNGSIQRNEAVYAKWRSKMPLYLVDEYRQNLLGLRGIFLDYGQKEEFTHIRSATSSLSKALAERGVPHVFEVYEGGDHVNKIRERLETRLFRFFSDRLDFSDQ